MTILKFYSNTCAPCTTLTNLLDAEKFSTPIEAINIKDKPEIALEYNIRKVPTLVFLDSDRNEKGREIGVVPMEKIKEILNDIQGNKTA